MLAVQQLPFTDMDSSAVAAVCFDVDGVLYHGTAAHPIPGAVEAVRSLWNTPAPQAQQKSAVPMVFLTNGTGFSEAQKAAELAEMLGLPVTSEHVVLASSPMRELVAELGDRRCLAVARTAAFAHELLAGYGFRDVTTTQEYAARHPTLFPQKRYPVDGAVGFEAEPPVAAVLLLQTPDDWGEAMQVCLDVLRSTGVPGRENEAAAQTVRLFSGNPDLDYGALHSVPRLTLGAFRVALALLFRESTGRELTVHGMFGKPYPEVYAYASKALQQQNGGVAPMTIYAVGDNPVSDIAGANAAGPQWHSILVRTGCFHGADNDATHPAKFVCNDAAAACRYILARER